MAGFKIKFEGIDELEKALKENVTMEDVKKVVKHNGQQLHEKIVKNADFKKGYQTGATKESIALEIQDGGMTAESGAKMDYDPYVEYGTRFMDAQPYVKPAFDAQLPLFKNDINRLMK